jgi:diacylglycerol O-acyltransferase / wax synthase
VTDERLGGRAGGRAGTATVARARVDQAVPSSRLVDWWRTWTSRSGHRPSTVPARALAAALGLWDVAAGLLVFGGYLLVAAHVATRLDAADRSARALYATERWLHLAPEEAANRWTAANPVIAALANYHYAVGYLATTLAVVLWLRLAHRPNYARHVTSLLAINVVAITIFFVWPVTPPRLLAGTVFVDTVKTHDTWGSWGTGLVSSTANQHAAMPSLHVAWATWVAVTLIAQGAPHWLRRAAVVHIGSTTAVIVMTGNHWIIDAFAGVAVAAAVELTVVAVLRARGGRLSAALGAPRGGHSPPAPPNPARIGGRR